MKNKIIIHGIGCFLLPKKIRLRVSEIDKQTCKMEYKDLLNAQAC